ncbi:MAG: S8 family serine peptidase [Candidatus Zixiibacteriota bacterium]
MQTKTVYKSPLIIIIGWLCLLLPQSFGSSVQNGSSPEELVCRMEPGYDIEIINITFGTTVRSYQPQIKCYLLIPPEDQDPESLAAVIDARLDVQYCGVNYYLVAPEPFQRSQPFLDNQGIGDLETQLAATTLDLVVAQEISIGLDVSVAILDGGIDFDHPEFVAKSGGVYSGWDFIDNDSIAFDEPGGSCSGHGTFVAGIVKLVAPAANIYAYRVLDTTGEGDGYNIAAAVLKAIDDGCKAINISFGMIGENVALDDALKYARDNDVLVIAAAGNDSTDSNLIFPFPASRYYCIAVAALDSLNYRADFSNFGVKVNVCAPGTWIYAPYIDTLYGWWNGTSFATPFVTGLAALIYSINQDIEWDDIYNIINQTATSVDSLNPGIEGLLGNGLINPVDALEMAGSQHIPGDANHDDVVNLLDIIYIISYMYREGPAPIPLASADADGSGNITILDMTYLIRYLYRDGPPPVAL